MEYTLNNLLDMDKDTFKMITSELSKTQLTQINSILTEYKSKNKIEIGDLDNIMLKLDYTKKAISDAVKSTIKKVKVHIKTNAEIASVKPSSTPAPKASTPKSNVSKSYGVNPLDYSISPKDVIFKKSNTKSTEGQIPQVKTARIKVTELDSKVITQLKSILGASKSNVEKQSSIDVKQSNREQKFKLADAKTALDNRKLDIQQKDADIRHEHEEAIKYKNKSADLMGKRKIRSDEKTLEMKLKGNALADEFRVQLEKTKKSKLKLAGDIQRDIINAKGENKRKSMNIENASKERMLIQKHEYAKEKELDKKKSREQPRQLKAKNDSQKNTKANLDSIHPALGLLYKLHKDREEKSEDGSGNFLGTAAGTALGSMGGGLMKGKGLRSGLGGIGIAGLMGLLETQKSGSMGKGAATFAGSIAGMELGAQAGLFVSGGNPIGGIIGGMIGGVLGETGAKQLYEKLFGKDKDTPANPDKVTPKQVNASEFLPESGRNASSNIAKNRANGFNKDGGRLSIPNSKAYKAPNGRNAQSDTIENTKNGYDKDGNAIDAQTQIPSNSSSFLANAENIRLNAYSDGKGKTSIGRGHQIKANELSQGYIQIGNQKIPISGANGIDTKLTTEQAESLFAQDSKSYGDEARGEIGAERFDKLNSNQKQALVSYKYNVGSLKSLKNKGLLKALDDGDTDGASKIIRNGINTKDGIFNKGVDSRRDSESKLFKEKPSSMSKGIQDAGDALDSAMQQQKSKPINVIQQGDTSNTGGNVVNNTYVNPQNTDATIRALQLQRQMPASIL